MKYLHYIILWAVILFILFFNQSDNDDKNTIYYKEINSDVTKESSGSGSPSYYFINKNDSGERFSQVYLTIPTEKTKRTLKTDMGNNSQRSYLFKPNKNNQQTIQKNINSSENELINDCTCEYKSIFDYDYEMLKSYDSDSIKYLSVDSFSTFSIDVDTVSYSYLKKLISNKEKNDIFNEKFNSLRIEEMINYFDYDYPLPEKETFNIVTEISKLSFEKDKYVLHIGIKGKEKKLSEIPPANLIFLIDTSGSMSEDKKLPLVKKSLIELTKNLRNIDKITIITYGNEANVFLKTTRGDKKDIITNKINELTTEGSTNGEEGLKSAYKTAEKTFVKNGINRIILCSDGEFNSGTINPENLKKMISDYRKQKIALTTLAFSDNYFNDDLLKKISTGSGNYYYINDFNEAVKVLSTQLTSTLNIIAKDVKVQVEFNPENIKSYRLIGYEENILNTEDFTNDEVDSNELGKGHSVTALYEIELKEKDVKKRYESETTILKNELAIVNIRYKEPNENKSKEVNKIINKKDIIENFANSSDNFKFSLAIAYFGLLLQSKISQNYIDLILKIAKSGKGTDKFGYKQEFVQLIENYKSYSYANKTYFDGGLNKEEIIKELNKNSDLFAKCFENNISNFKNDLIKIPVQFEVNNNGIIVDAFVVKASSYTQKENNFDICLINQFKQLKFEKSENKTIAYFEIGFNKRVLNSNNKVEIYF